MNNQEAFDTVLHGLRKQGRSSVKGLSCVYRADNGEKCAAGMLIPDALYQPWMENKPIEELVQSDVFLRNALAGVDVRLLGRLQYAHDTVLDNNGLDAWEGRMHGIAKEFGLNYTEPA